MGAGDLFSVDSKNAGVLIVVFVSFLSSKCGFQEFHGSEATLKSWSNRDVALGQANLEESGSVEHIRLICSIVECTHEC